MFGINGLEFVILAIAAVMIIGPERLPEYAAQLGRLVRELRRMATGARQQLRDEVGPDFDDVDWRKLDPRQYDPRRIIKEALWEEDAPFKPQSPHRPQPQTTNATSAAAATSSASGAAPGSNSTAGSTAGSVQAGVENQPGGAAARGSHVGAARTPPRKFEQLAAHHRAPFDSEAT